MIHIIHRQRKKGTLTMAEIPKRSDTEDDLQQILQGYIT
jgi:hypothetical protein